MRPYLVPTDADGESLKNCYEKLTNLNLSTTIVNHDWAEPTLSREAKTCLQWGRIISSSFSFTSSIRYTVMHINTYLRTFPPDLGYFSHVNI